MARHVQDYREGEGYRKQVRTMRISTIRSASPDKLAWAGDSPMEALRRLACLAALALLITLLMASGATAQPLYGGGQMGDNSMSAPSDNAMSAPPNNTMASPAASASATPNAMSPSSATASATPTATATRGDHKGGGSASDAVGGRLPTTGGAPLASLRSVGALALLLGSGLVAVRLLHRGS